MKTLDRLLAGNDGAVAVEAALVLSVLLAPMLLCLWDFSQLYQGQANVDEALQDTVTYVMSTGSNATAAGAISAAQAANGNGITVSTSTVCYCVSTSTSAPTMPTSVSCTSSCTGSSVFQKFMKVVATNSVMIPFPVPWIKLTSPYTMTATAYVRTG
jgi:Flp pilus assembly protein TadG